MYGHGIGGAAPCSIKWKNPTAGVQAESLEASLLYFVIAVPEDLNSSEVRHSKANTEYVQVKCHF